MVSPYVDPPQPEGPEKHVFFASISQYVCATEPCRSLHRAMCHFSVRNVDFGDEVGSHATHLSHIVHQVPTISVCVMPTKTAIKNHLLWNPQLLAWVSY